MSPPLSFEGMGGDDAAFYHSVYKSSSIKAPGDVEIGTRWQRTEVWVDGWMLRALID